MTIAGIKANAPRFRMRSATPSAQICVKRPAKLATCLARCPTLMRKYQDVVLRNFAQRSRGAVAFRSANQDLKMKCVDNRPHVWKRGLYNLLDINQSVVDAFET